MNIEETLQKWYRAKKDLQRIEKDIEKYKSEIMREMNKKGVEKLSEGSYSVSRRRNTRKYVSKESLPKSIWNQYATSLYYDSYHLVKR